MAFASHWARIWNVAPLNPMLTAVRGYNRATLDGKNPNGWFPEQKLTV